MFRDCYVDFNVETSRNTVAIFRYAPGFKAEGGACCTNIEWISSLKSKAVIEFLNDKPYIFIWDLRRLLSHGIKEVSEA
ncbi:hypothetical protein EMIT0196MI5_40287 [Pseudomonas sp. IT-196MI5]